MTKKSKGTAFYIIASIIAILLFVFSSVLGTGATIIFWNSPVSLSDLAYNSLWLLFYIVPVVFFFIHVLASKKKPGFNLFAILMFLTVIIENAFYSFRRIGYHFESFISGTWTILEVIEIIICVVLIILLACKANCRFAPIFFALARVITISASLGNSLYYLIRYNVFDYFDSEYFIKDLLAYTIPSFMDWVATLIFLIAMVVFFIRNGNPQKMQKSSTFNPEEELKKLNADLELGLITREEYNLKRTEILTKL